jgi:hypothetical protein
MQERETLGYIDQMAQVEMAVNFVGSISTALGHNRSERFDRGALGVEILTVMRDKFGDKDHPSVTQGDIDEVAGDILRVASLRIIGKDPITNYDTRDSIYASIHAELMHRVTEEIEYKAFLRVNPKTLREITDNRDDPIEDVVAHWVNSQSMATGIDLIELTDLGGSDTTPVWQS